MHQITSALKPFHICPRCSKFQLKRNNRCKSCGFGIAGWGCQMVIVRLYFSTGKYFILQNKNIITGIARMLHIKQENAPEPRLRFIIRPKFRFELDIEISLRATDDDIEKLILLM